MNWLLCVLSRDCGKSIVRWISGGYSVLAGSVPASGFQPSCICIDDTGSMAFILRYQGDSSCTVVAYDCKNHTIEMETSLPGVPMDMIYSEGRLLIPTTE